MFSIEETYLKRVAEKSGYAVSAGVAKGNPLTGRILVEDLEVANPEAFPSPDFLSMAELKVRFSPASLLGRTLRVKEMAVHLRHLTGVRTEDGTVNIREFRLALERREERAEPRKPRPRDLEIGRLRVRVDRVATVGFADGDWRRREYRLDYRREFCGVSGWLDVAGPMVDDFACAGLARHSDAIFATLLPDLIWERIEAPRD